MSLTPELVAELEVLALFNLDSSQEGLKTIRPLPRNTLPPPNASSKKNSPTSPMAGI
jgi:hypothetical protein